VLIAALLTLWVNPRPPVRVKVLLKAVLEVAHPECRIKTLSGNRHVFDKGALIWKYIIIREHGRMLQQ